MVANLDDSKGPLIRRGRVDSIDLYEIKDSELDALEKGQDANLHLNFAIFLLSSALSALTALLTATFNSRIWETVFIAAFLIGITGGIYLMILWYRGMRTKKDVCKEIRKRINSPTPPTTPVPNPPIPAEVQIENDGDDREDEEIKPKL